MKKRITALLALLLWMLPAQAGAASVGEVVGHVYSTDITAYVDGMLIPSYNIGGKTAVIAEDLMEYGFEVVWDGENRILSVSAQEVPATAPVPVIPEENRMPGQVIGDVYQTDITVTVNGLVVDACNIGGRTAIAFDAFGGKTKVEVDEYGEEKAYVFTADGSDIPAWMNDNAGYSMSGFRKVWDEEGRIASLEVLRKGSFVEVDGNRYRISEMNYPGHGTQVYLIYIDAAGNEKHLGDGLGFYGDHVSVTLLQNVFGDNWTMEGGKLTLDLRGERKQILRYSPSETPTDAYIIGYFSSNAISPTKIPYITIPVTVIREDGETAHELKGAVYRGEVLIEMDSFLEIL